MRSLLLALVTGGCVGACASVLGFVPTPPTPFPHRSHAVAGISCTRCHAGVAQANDDTPVRLPDDEGCRECHRLGETARPCRRGQTQNCRACHGDADVSRRAEQARTHLLFSHLRHVQSLDGTCVRCHEGVQRDDARLLPQMADCLACHQHEDDFDLGRCDGCHVNVAEDVGRPNSHVVHGADFTRDHGAQASAQAGLCATCHSDAECASCHGVKVPALAQRLQLLRPRLAGIHRANFVSRHALEARSDPGLCTTCHQTDTCQRCHEDAGVTRGASPHPAGWVGLNRNLHGPAARLDPVSCAGCHGGAGEMLCVSCHKSGGIGGSPHPPGFESNKRRTERPCALCH